jgi:beta-lactamase superfamily II metal-dependent hydrolase
MAGTNWIFSPSSLGSANIGKADKAEMPHPQPSSSSQLPPSTSTILSAGNSNNSDSYEADTWANGTLANQGELKIVFIDVGQGDSILIIMPSNDTVLIDGGDRQSSDEVLSILNELAISEIDALVATHPHADHIGGLINVIKNANVGQIIDSGQVHTTQTFEDLLDAIYAAQIPLRSVREGDSINIDPHVKLDVLNPPGSLPVGTNNEDVFNDNSVVI